MVFPYKAGMGSPPVYKLRSYDVFPPLQTLGRVGTSFGCSDFWDCLDGQALVMIGRWYSVPLRQPLTNLIIHSKYFSVSDWLKAHG